VKVGQFVAGIVKINSNTNIKFKHKLKWVDFAKEESIPNLFQVSVVSGSKFMVQSLWFKVEAEGSSSRDKKSGW